MQTLTIDILNNKVERLLEDLEQLQLIRVRKEGQQKPLVINWAAKYKTSMSEQSEGKFSEMKTS